MFIEPNKKQVVNLDLKLKVSHKIDMVRFSFDSSKTLQSRERSSLLFPCLLSFLQV